MRHLYAFLFLLSALLLPSRSYAQLSGSDSLRLAPLAQKVDDTYRLTGADVMVTADDIYEDLRKDNGETAAVQAPLAQMRRRYQHRKATSTSPAPVPGKDV